MNDNDDSRRARRARAAARPAPGRPTAGRSESVIAVVHAPDTIREVDERREARDDARVAAAAEVAVHELRNALLPHLLRDGPARSHPDLASALERALDQADALAAVLRGDS